MAAAGSQKTTQPSSFELHAMGQVFYVQSCTLLSLSVMARERLATGQDRVAVLIEVLPIVQIESGFFPTEDNLYCTWSLHHGSDWQVVAGTEEGTTQLASVPAGRPAKVVWNFPVDLTFKSTNVYGWPQLVLAVYGTDFLWVTRCQCGPASPLLPIVGLHAHGSARIEC